LIVTIALLYSVYYVSSQVYTVVPGANDDEKTQNLIKGVTSARNWLAGQPCTNPFFRNPDDLSENINWASFLCTLWGGPAGAHENCSYFFRNVHDVNTSLIVDAAILPLIMSEIHLSASQGFAFNDQQFNMTRDALVFGIYYGGSASLAFRDGALLDLEDLRDNIVTSGAPACPGPAATINWRLNTNAGTTTINPGQEVRWVWGDTSQHSVQALGATFQFLGWGGGPKALATGTQCTTAGSPCLLLGNNMTYAWRFDQPCQTINYRCTIHDTMVGTIQVLNNGGTACTSQTSTTQIVATTAGSNTAAGDGTGQGSSFVEPSSASAMASWISILF